MQASILPYLSIQLLHRLSAEPQSQIISGDSASAHLGPAEMMAACFGPIHFRELFLKMSKLPPEA